MYLYEERTTYDIFEVLHRLRVLLSVIANGYFLLAGSDIFFTWKSFFFLPLTSITRPRAAASTHDSLFKMKCRVGDPKGHRKIYIIGQPDLMNIHRLLS